jgi:hypothetical protein
MLSMKISFIRSSSSEARSKPMQLHVNVDIKPHRLAAATAFGT